MSFSGISSCLSTLCTFQSISGSLMNVIISIQNSCAGIMSGQIQGQRQRNSNLANSTSFMQVASSVQTQFSGSMSDTINFLLGIISQMSTMVSNTMTSLYAYNLRYFVGIAMAQVQNSSSCTSSYGTNLTTTVINSNNAITTALNSLLSLFFSAFGSMISSAFSCYTTAFQLVGNLATCSSSSTSCQESAVS